MNVTVYLSSKTDIAPEFAEATASLAHGLGEMGATLVYGGSNAGQMHRLASVAKQSGAKVVGIIPEVFRRLADPVADEIIYTANLSERKQRLYEMGDVFVALPGGIGTLDEVMSTLAEMTVNRNFGKRIILVNVNGIFDHLMDQLDCFQRLKLADSRAIATVISVDSAEECLSMLKNLI